MEREAVETKVETEQTPPTRFGDAVRGLRKARGLGIDRLADISGIPAAVLWQAEMECVCPWPLNSITAQVLLLALASERRLGDGELRGFAELTQLDDRIAAAINEAGSGIDAIVARDRARRGGPLTPAGGLSPLEAIGERGQERQLLAEYAPIVGKMVLARMMLRDAVLAMEAAGMHVRLLIQNAVGFPLEQWVRGGDVCLIVPLFGVVEVGEGIEASRQRGIEGVKAAGVGLDGEALTRRTVPGPGQGRVNNATGEEAAVAADAPSAKGGA